MTASLNHYQYNMVKGKDTESRLTIKEQPFERIIELGLFSEWNAKEIINT